ncbi:hypothetical protein [Microbacterium tumbae]
MTEGAVDDYDVILPIRGYDPAAAYTEIGRIRGALMMQLSRFEQLTKRQLDGMCSVDSRFGGVAERLDRLDERMEHVEESLDRILRLVEHGERAPSSR